MFTGALLRGRWSRPRDDDLAHAQRLQLSARAFHCVLKLARTIADLAESNTIVASHLAERSVRTGRTADHPARSTR